MASGRIKMWFKSLPLTSGGSDSHRARQSNTSRSSATTSEATPAATRKLTGDPVVSVPMQIDLARQATTSPGAAHQSGSKMANEYMKNIKHFRILIMGRANAGKTTILQQVCNSTDRPEVFDGKGNKIESNIVQGSLARGYHNMEYELVFRSNPGFVFHDSCGFEAGSTRQFDEVKNFVVDHAAVARSVNKRIHAIWYCIPMTESQRAVTAAEKKFFNECDTGYVPVIVILTKCETLQLDVIEGLQDEGWEMEEAHENIDERGQKLLKKWLAHIKHELDMCRFPPRGYVSLQDMHQENADCTALMQYTANVLNEEGLQRLLISTQQSSILLCIEYAVKLTLRKKMELGIKDSLQVDANQLADALLSWFPNCEGYAKTKGFYLSGDLVYYARGDTDDAGDWYKTAKKNVDELVKFEVDTHVPMPPLGNDVTLLGKFPTVQSMAEHAIKCLLVAEHSYFLMQHGHHMWREVLSLAVEEYKICNLQPVISQAVKAIFYDHNGDMDSLCEAIISIIKGNRMSNKLLLESGGK